MLILLKKKHALRAETMQKARKLDGRINFNGLEVSIETGRSRCRVWYDPHNKSEGMSRMALPYGYIKGTLGTDGDHVDVFVGPDHSAPEVYVIHTTKAPDFTEYDEDKCVLGVGSPEAAQRAFSASYSDPQFYGGMSIWPFEEFKAHVLSSEAKGQPLRKSGEEYCKKLGDQLGIDWKQVDLDAFCDGMFEEDGKHGSIAGAARVVIANLKKDPHCYSGESKSGRLQKALFTVAEIRERAQKAYREACTAAGGNWNDLNPEEFYQGMKEEMEHRDVTGGDLVLTAKIVLAHLREDASYYSKLERLQKARKTRLLAGAYW